MERLLPRLRIDRVRLEQRQARGLEVSLVKRCDAFIETLLAHGGRVGPQGRGFHAGAHDSGHAGGVGEGPPRITKRQSNHDERPLAPTLAARGDPWQLHRTRLASGVTRTFEVVSSRCARHDGAAAAGGAPPWRTFS